MNFRVKKHNSKTADEILFDRARCGEQEAFEALVYRHETKVFNYLHWLTLGKTDAVVLFRETFLRIYLRRFHLDSGMVFLPLLYRFATETALDSQHWLKKRTMPAFKNLGAPPSSSSPIDFGAYGALSKAFTSLPTRRRSIFLLSRYVAMDYPGIALTMRISVPKVHAHMVAIVGHMSQMVKGPR
jgi:DNA-directed RNA polymerase specialized sigma24 family protein